MSVLCVIGRFSIFPSKARIEGIMELVHPNDVERVGAALEVSLDFANPKHAATELRSGRGMARSAR